MKDRTISSTLLSSKLQKQLRIEIAKLQTNKKIDLYQFETELRKELEAITKDYKSYYGVRTMQPWRVEEESIDGDYTGNITMELLIVMTRRLASRYKESFKEDVEEMIQNWAERTQPAVGHVSVDVRIHHPY